MIPRRLTALRCPLLGQCGQVAKLLLTLDWRTLILALQTVYRSMSESAEILQGTLDLLVLRTLELGPLHGLGVSDRIKQTTSGVFVVKPGSLFPALHRLEQNGWIRGSGANPRITAARSFT